MKMNRVVLQTKRGNTHNIERLKFFYISRAYHWVHVEKKLFVCLGVCVVFMHG